MKMYVLSLGAGLLVGVIYALLNVRSPAPPVIALLGLLGILIGEQVVPLAKRALGGEGITLSWMRQECTPHIFGDLPRQASKTGGRDDPASDPTRPG